MDRLILELIQSNNAARRALRIRTICLIVVMICWVALAALYLARLVWS